MNGSGRKLLRRSIALTRTIGDHDRRARAAGRERCVVWFVANRYGGVTYKHLASAHGLSERRVITEIARARGLLGAGDREATALVRRLVGGLPAGLRAVDPLDLL